MPGKKTPVSWHSQRRSKLSEQASTEESFRPSLLFPKMLVLRAFRSNCILGTENLIDWNALCKTENGNWVLHPRSTFILGHEALEGQQRLSAGHCFSPVLFIHVLKPTRKLCSSRKSQGRLRVLLVGQERWHMGWNADQLSRRTGPTGIPALELTGQVSELQLQL